MSIAVDTKLFEQSNGSFDIKVGSDGDLIPEYGFDNALINSVLTEQRADESEMPPPERRRGWFGDLVAIDSSLDGSKLWLLYQSKNTQNTVNMAENYVKKSLQWLIDDGYVDQVLVNAIRSFDEIVIEVKLFVANNIVDSRLFSVWQNTGIGK